MDFSDRLKYYADLASENLERSLKSAPDLMQGEIIEAMRYSLLAGGKRIRPVLTLEFCRVCGGDIMMALPFACAIEMIHTYSLIHDDLPCMDNDDYRRGKLTNHKVYGEDMAVLAGDALLNCAFETVLSEDNCKKLSLHTVVAATRELAKFSGIFGMIGGQVIDIKNDNSICDLERIINMDLHKTAALIRACAKMGCIVGGGSSLQIAAADEYSKNIGLAFQIEDDILDVTGDFKKLGKKIGSDEKSKKNTYVSLLGIEKSKQLAKEMTEKAISGLCVFDETDFLTCFAKKLLNRES